MKGFQGDTTEIERFVKSMKAFEKAIRYMKERVDATSD